MSFRYNAYDHVPCYDDIHRSPAEISYEIVDMTISSLITDDQHTAAPTSPNTVSHN